MMNEMSRRAFARIVATAAVAIPNVAPALTFPAEDQPAPSAALSPASQAEVDARVQWIFTKYGSRLDDQQRADIRRIIGSGQSGIDDMRKFALENATEPVEPFRPYRKAAAR
jgi:hypothetical protein